MSKGYLKLSKELSMKKMISHFSQTHEDWTHDQIVAAAASECGISTKNDYNLEVGTRVALRLNEYKKKYEHLDLKQKLAMAYHDITKYQAYNDLGSAFGEISKGYEDFVEDLTEDSFDELLEWVKTEIKPSDPEAVAFAIINSRKKKGKEDINKTPEEKKESWKKEWSKIGEGFEKQREKRKKINADLTEDSARMPTATPARGVGRPRNRGLKAKTPGAMISGAKRTKVGQNLQKQGVPLAASGQPSVTMPFSIQNTETGEVIEGNVLADPNKELVQMQPLSSSNAKSSGVKGNELVVAFQENNESKFYRYQFQNHETAIQANKSLQQSGSPGRWIWHNMRGHKAGEKVTPQKVGPSLESGKPTIGGTSASLTNYRITKTAPSRVPGYKEASEKLARKTSNPLENFEDRKRNITETSLQNLRIMRDKNSPLFENLQSRGIKIEGDSTIDITEDYPVQGYTKSDGTKVKKHERGTSFSSLGLKKKSVSEIKKEKKPEKYKESERPKIEFPNLPLGPKIITKINGLSGNIKLLGDVPAPQKLKKELMGLAEEIYLAPNFPSNTNGLLLRLEKFERIIDLLKQVSSQRYIDVLAETYNTFGRIRSLIDAIKYEAEEEEIEKSKISFTSLGLKKTKLDLTTDSTSMSGILTRSGKFDYRVEGGGIKEKIPENLELIIKKTDHVPVFGRRTHGSHKEAENTLIGFAHDLKFIPKGKLHEEHAFIHGGVEFFYDIEDLLDLEDPDDLSVSFGFEDAGDGTTQDIVKLHHLAVSLNNLEKDRCSTMNGPACTISKNDPIKELLKNDFILEGIIKLKMTEISQNNDQNQTVNDMETNDALEVLQDDLKTKLGDGALLNIKGKLYYKMKDKDSLYSIDFDAPPGDNLPQIEAPMETQTGEDLKEPCPLSKKKTKKENDMTVKEKTGEQLKEKDVDAAMKDDNEKEISKTDPADKSDAETPKKPKQMDFEKEEPEKPAFDMTQMKEYIENVVSDMVKSQVEDIEKSKKVDDLRETLSKAPYGLAEDFLAGKTYDQLIAHRESIENSQIYKDFQVNEAKKAKLIEPEISKEIFADFEELKGGNDPWASIKKGGNA